MKRVLYIATHCVFEHGDWHHRLRKCFVRMIFYDRNILQKNSLCPSPASGKEDIQANRSVSKPLLKRLETPKDSNQEYEIVFVVIFSRF